MESQANVAGGEMEATLDGITGHRPEGQRQARPEIAQEDGTGLTTSESVPRHEVPDRAARRVLTDSVPALGCHCVRRAYELAANPGLARTGSNFGAFAKFVPLPPLVFYRSYRSRFALRGDFLAFRRTSGAAVRALLAL